MPSHCSYACRSPVTVAWPRPIRAANSEPRVEWVVSHDELLSRFAALPADRFPHIRRYAAELISGTGHERFDFTLGLIVDNLTRPPAG